MPTVLLIRRDGNDDKNSGTMITPAFSPKDGKFSRAEMFSHGFASIFFAALQIIYATFTHVAACGSFTRFGAIFFEIWK